MARYSAGCLTGAGSTSLPIIAVAAGSNNGGSVVEISVSNTATTEVSLKVVRLSTAGTPGTGLVEGKFDPNSRAADCTAYGTYSSTGPTLEDLGYRCMLSNAKGSGWTWAFGDTGLRFSTGTGNGIGVVVENGTGQACQAYIVWDE